MSTSAEVKVLVEAQHDIHGRISRSVDNLRKMGMNNITSDAIQARLTILDNLWQKMETQHELIRTALKEKYKESEYATSDFIEVAENTYVTQRSTLTGYAKKLHGETSVVSRGESIQEQAHKTSLPRIKLPTFSGSYEEWPSFRDLFLSVVGENASVSDIERFHYLRSCVKGAAEKLIKSLTVTGDNYHRAWAMLYKHFENKRELIRTNFAAFTSVSKMKGESAEELERIHNAVTTTVNAQESIGRPVNSHGMDLLNFLTVELFDPRTRLEWESSTCDSTDPPDHDTLVNFISKRILTLNAAKPKANPKTSSDPPRSAKSHFAKNGSDSLKCAACSGKHTLMQCSEFRAKPASERKSFVENHRLCFNCLGTHMMAKCQSTKTCISCKSRHHSLLHDAYQSAPSNEASSLSVMRPPSERKAILLATARVTIADHMGRPQAVRVLIDQGSEVSLIAEALAQRLRLPRARSSLSIVGIGGARSGITRGKITLNLSSGVTGATLPVVAYILPRLSAYSGPIVRQKTSWPHICGLPLADPDYLKQDRVELLLGADVCSQILEEGLRKGRKEEPIAQKTALGWILSGGCKTASPHAPLSSLQCSVDYELNELVQRFWEQDREPSAPVALTPDEERCEEIFARTHSRTFSGRYMVRLPLSGSPPSLPETRKPAERLLFAMERRCTQDAQFGELYHAFMQEYETLQHMETINTVTTLKNTCASLCYLPHHGVLRELSTTTKLRVVFNGSQRTKSGSSLNAQLLVGANLLPVLADVLLRWRWHRYVLITDIEKMYRQILVHPEDRDLQRILWRNNSASQVREYRLKTVTYGLACAPFLAIRTLLQLASDEGSQYPRGASAIRHNTYVDDVVTGANTLSEATALQRELRSLCTAGGFPLRKWAANHDDILAGVPQEHRLTSTPHTWAHEGHSTLGLNWHPVNDHFSYTIQARPVGELTKRRVLAETTRLFNPLRWLTPVVMRAKILIQSLWLQ